MRRRWACRLLSKLDFESMKFSLLFLGMTPPESVPEDPKDRVLSLAKVWYFFAYVLCLL